MCFHHRLLGTSVISGSTWIVTCRCRRTFSVLCQDVLLPCVSFDRFVTPCQQPHSDAGGRTRPLQARLRQQCSRRHPSLSDAETAVRPQCSGTDTCSVTRSLTHTVTHSLTRSTNRTTDTTKTRREFSSNDDRMVSEHIPWLSPLTLNITRPIYIYPGPRTNDFMSRGGQPKLACLSCLAVHNRRVAHCLLIIW